MQRGVVVAALLISFSLLAAVLLNGSNENEAVPAGLDSDPRGQPPRCLEHHDEPRNTQPKRRDLPAPVRESDPPPAACNN